MKRRKRRQGTRPRLLVVSTTFPRRPGDCEPDFIWQLCEQLGDEFRVIVLVPNGRDLKPIERMGKSIVVRWRYAPAHMETLAYKGGLSERLRAFPALWLLVPWFLVGLAIKASALLRQRSFAVIHVHWMFPTLPLVLLARDLAAQRQIPVTCTAHGADVHGFRSPLLLKIKLWALRRCNAIAAVSKALAQRINQDCPGLTVDVLPMGIRPVATTTNHRSPAGLLFVGRLVEKKGAATAVSVVAELLRRQRDVRLTIIGDGPERPKLDGLIATYGISGRVSLLGAQPGPEVSARFASAGIALLPFRTARNGDAEGLGLVALEALAGGCPLITSDTEVTRSFLTHGRHALLVAPDDVSGFADAVESTIDGYDEALRRTHIAAGEVINRYQWASVGHDYRNWLRGATRNPQNPDYPTNRTEHGD